MGERERYFSEMHSKMSGEEYQAFQKFREEGNENIEKDMRMECSPWKIDFITFLKMIQVFGSHISRIDSNKPFRIVIDYDPEQVRVAMHGYTTDANAQ